jgi:hypothetical protein
LSPPNLTPTAQQLALYQSILSPADFAAYKAALAQAPSADLYNPPAERQSLPVIPGVPTDSYSQWRARMEQYADYARAQGATEGELATYMNRLEYMGFPTYGNGDPAAGWALFKQQAALPTGPTFEGATPIGSDAPAGSTALPATGYTGGGTPPTGPVRETPRPPIYEGPPITNPTPIDIPPPHTGGGVPPPVGGAGGPRATYTPLPGGGGAPGNPYEAINSLLPGYGLSQNLQGFGIPGFETSPLYGGGSWAGTTFNPPPAPTRTPAPPSTGGGSGGGGGGGGGNYTQTWGWVQVPAGSSENPITVWKPVLGGQQGIPAEPGTAEYDALKNKMIAAQADAIYTAQGGNYQSIVNNLISGDKWMNNTLTSSTAGDAAAAAGKFAISKAVPYVTSPFDQTYGGKVAPYANIHEQIGAAMQGVPAAYPGFAWANPAVMKAAQPGATGMPPGGWTQMLGYTPGAPANYGFIGGRPNPYGSKIG